MDFKLQSYGECAVFIQELDQRKQFCMIEALEASVPEGFVEYVIGYSNILVIFESSLAVTRFPEWLMTISLSAATDTVSPRLLKVPVHYNGVDLAEVAALTNLTQGQVIEVHSEAEYSVRMIGFAPGFPYLDGLDSRLHLDRRESPRNHIAPGSVAIGGSHTGIYSVASPGGWHILGYTDHPLFQVDLAKENPVDERAVFGLMSGDRVKFVGI